MKTFKDYLTEEMDETLDIQSLLNESHDLTKEQDAAIDMAVDRIMEEHKNGKDLETVVDEIVNEGILGSIFGGLTGFALGKTIGKAIAKVLGIQKGALYDLMTSRLVGAALGAVLGKRI
tara:strand:+ start:2480 stop:2836 length:357 start_codon:yes stop_codon:yes gene_type:complete